MKSEFPSVPAGMRLHRPGVLIVFLMLTHAHFNISCPTSCVVCSEDAIICRKLSSVIEVPNTTKVLMLTDGLIQLIDNNTLSSLSNITLLGLSSNIISNIMENAFNNLTLLRTLQLDHNHITSFSILNSTFTQLQNLEILQLGNNAIQDINGIWFKGMQSLLVLHLEGNLISRLTSDTFQSANLENLETLDLSDNLIESLAKGSFYRLPRLRNLDLSRNNLHSAPDAFSYLSWLSALNLDLNKWNCTCELHELSSFLSSYIQAPDKVLYNGRQMVCLSTANPAVQTVLQLTEANCVPPNQNITVLVKAENSISTKHYARDISLAACFFFFGGVGLTVTIIYIIYCKPRPNKSLRHWRGWNCDEEQEEIQNQGSPQCSFSGNSDVQILTITHPGHEAKLMFPNSKEQAKSKACLGDRGLGNARAARPECHFSCHQCSSPGSAPVSMKSGSEADVRRAIILDNPSQREPYTRSMLTAMEENRRPVAQPQLKASTDFRVQSHYQSSKTLQHPSSSQGESLLKSYHLDTANGPERLQDHRSHLSTYQKHIQTQLQRDRRANESHGGNNGFKPKVQNTETLPGCLTLTCVHCQKSYKYILEVSKGSSRTEKINTEENIEDKQIPSNLETRLYRESNLNLLNDHEGLMAQSGEHLRKRAGVQRNVTFNLKQSEIHMVNAQKKKRSHNKVKNNEREMLQDEETWNGSEKTFKSDKGVKLVPKTRHKDKGQSSRLLKVKIELNPFKKSRIHPNNKMQLSLEKKAPETTVKSEKMKEGDQETVVSETRENIILPKEKNKNGKRSKGHIAREKTVSQSQSTKKSHDQSTQQVKSSRSNNSENMNKIQDSTKQPVHEEPVECESNEKKIPKVKLDLKSKQRRSTFLENDAEEPQINKSQGTEDTNTARAYSAETEKIPLSSDILTSTSQDQNECLEFRRNEDTQSPQGGIPLELLKQHSKAGTETDQYIDTELNHGSSVRLKRTSSGLSQLQSVMDQTEEIPAGGEEEGQVISNVYPSQRLELKSVPQGENAVIGIIQEMGQSVNPESPKPIFHESKEDSVNSFKIENKQNTALGGSPSGGSSGPSFTQPQFQGPQDKVAPLVLQANITEPLYSQAPLGVEPITGPHHDGAQESSQVSADSPKGENISNNNSMDPAPLGPLLVEQQVPSREGSPKRKICLILPEKSDRPKTALEKKIR